MKHVRKKARTEGDMKEPKLRVGTFSAPDYPTDGSPRKPMHGVRRQSRKALRKESRKLKKMRMHAFKQKKPLPTVESLESERKVKLKELREKKRKLQEKQNAKQKKQMELKKLEDAKAQKEAEWLSNKKKDERMLKQLEKNLKMKKNKKSLPSAFITDGLDYILDVVDREKVKSLASESNAEFLQKDSDSPSDDEEYVTKSKRSDADDMEVNETDDDSSDSCDDGSFFKNVDVDEDEDESNCDVTDEESEGDYSSDDNKVDEMEVDCVIKRPSAEQPKLRRLETSKHSIDGTMSADSILKVNGKLTKSKKVQFSDEVGVDAKNAVHEDIYGRLKDGHGNVVESLPAGAAYIPPGKRQLHSAAVIDGGEKNIRVDIMLMRQLKGQINRLSESNLQSVGNKIESLCREYSRADTTTALTDVILEACLLPSLAPPRVCSDVALLVALLHHRVGSEVSFTVLQSLATRYHLLFNELSLNPDAGKQIENAVALLCWFYSFKVISCQFILDLANQLIERLCGRDIELLLILLKATGFGLRKDSPEEFKKLLSTIQVKAGLLADENKPHDKSRMKFLLDTLVSIRSNSDLKLLGLDEKQHLQHLHKLLNVYTKGSHECELRVTLNDVLNAAHNGKWFVIGAAWHGNKQSAEEENQKKDSSVKISVSDKLAKKARAMGMNTELRRTVFNILATCENYVDAFEKLMQLAAQQQHQKQREMAYRELVYVVIQLCLHEGPSGQSEDVENTINMFYILLLERLCQSHNKRNIQVAVKFTIRHQIQLIAETELAPSRLTRLADTTHHLISRSIIGLAVLKDVDFINISNPMHKFLKRLLRNVLSQLSEISVETVFRQIVDKPPLLSKQIQLYLKLFFKRQTIDEELLRRIKLAERAMTSVT